MRRWPTSPAVRALLTVLDATADGLDGDAGAGTAHRADRPGRPGVAAPAAPGAAPRRRQPAAARFRRPARRCARARHPTAGALRRTGPPAAAGARGAGRRAAQRRRRGRSALHAVAGMAPVGSATALAGGQRTRWLSGRAGRPRPRRRHRAVRRRRAVRDRAPRAPRCAASSTTSPRSGYRRRRATTAPRPGRASPVLSAHAALGREWDFVVIAGLQEGLWPNIDSPRRRARHPAARRRARRRRRPRDRACRRRAPLLAEERRLLIAAMGRARSRLLVTAVDSDARRRVDAAVAVLLRTRARWPPTPTPEPQSRSTRRGCWRPRRWSAGCGRWCARRDGAVDDTRTCLRRSAIGAAGRGRRPGRRPRTVVRHDAAVSTDEPLWSGDDHVVTLSPSTLQTLTDCPLRWLLERHGGSDARDVRSAIGSLVHALVADPGKTESQMLNELEKVWEQAAVRFASGMPTTSWRGTARCCRRSRSGARRPATSSPRWAPRSTSTAWSAPATTGPACASAVGSTGWNATARAGWSWSTSRPARARSARTTRSATPSWRCTSWPSPKGCCRRGTQPGGGRLVYLGKTGAGGAAEREQDALTPERTRRVAGRRCGRRRRPPRGRSSSRASTTAARTARCGRAAPPRPPLADGDVMTPRYSPAELASALGLFAPTDEQAAVIAAPPGRWW